jgi:oxygen-independent coproporphyrinogen-3 oxidase
VTVGGALLATRRHRAPEPWAERVEREGHGSTAEETVAPRDRAREALLMGLRLAEGVDAAWFAARTGLALRDAIDEGILAACVETGYLVQAGGRLTATAQGRRRLDALLPRLVL